MRNKYVILTSKLKTAEASEQEAKYQQALDSFKQRYQVLNVESKQGETFALKLGNPRKLPVLVKATKAMVTIIDDESFAQLLKTGFSNEGLANAN